jgi:hypothetical protein
MRETQDVSDGTVGWFAFGTGTVGITKGETLRLSVVNTGPTGVTVVCGIWQNPRMVEDSYALQSGQSKHCDVDGAEVSKEHFDKTGRVQLRALVRSSARVLANMEIFDTKTGRTSCVLLLQELHHN